MDKDRKSIKYLLFAPCPSEIGRNESLLREEMNEICTNNGLTIDLTLSHINAMFPHLSMNTPAMYPFEACLDIAIVNSQLIDTP